VIEIVTLVETWLVAEIFIDIMSAMFGVTIRIKTDCTDCKQGKSRLNTEREWHGPLQARLSGKCSVSPRCHATSSPDRLLALRTTFHLIYNVTPVLCDLPPPPLPARQAHTNITRLASGFYHQVEGLKEQLESCLHSKH